MIRLFVSLFLVCFFATTSWSITKIACVGNSITFGYDQTNAASQGYEPTLQALLGASNFQIENDGFSGATAIRKGSIPYWTTGKFDNIFKFKPDWVTIKLGTNDSRPNFWPINKGQFRKDYLAIIDTLGTLSPKPKIWIVFPCPTTRTQTDRPNDANVLQIIDTLKAIAKARNLPTIDCHTPLVSVANNVLGSDGIHPNKAGYDSLAHIFYRALSLATATRENVDSRKILRQESGTMRLFLHPDMSFTNICSKVVLGTTYSLKVFDAKGTLLARSNVVNTPGNAQAFFRSLPKKTTGVRLVELRRIGN